MNIYSPCGESEKIKFLTEVERIIKNTVPHEYLANVICLGDFNNVLDNDLDIITGSKHPARTVIKFNDFITELGLIDIWRRQNPNTKVFTWSRGSPVIARRLDYILIGENVSMHAINSNIKTIGFSDHRAGTLALNF